MASTSLGSDFLPLRSSQDLRFCDVLMLGFVEEEHILEYMASYLGIPEDAVPPPLRRFVSQAPTLPITSIFWGKFRGIRMNSGIPQHFPKNMPKFPEKTGPTGQVTMGNPLYIRETLDQLLQDGNLKARPVGRGHIFVVVKQKRKSLGKFGFGDDDDDDDDPTRIFLNIYWDESDKRFNQHQCDFFCV